MTDEQLLAKVLDRDSEYRTSGENVMAAEIDRLTADKAKLLKAVDKLLGLPGVLHPEAAPSEETTDD